MLYKEAVKDLGVVQGKGLTGKALAAKMWVESVGRLQQIATPPVGFEKKDWLVSSSAMAAGAFWGAARSQPVQLWGGMRQNVLAADHTGSNNVSCKLWFCASGISWRCDPIGLLLCRGVHFLAMACQTGEFSEERLARLSKSV